ncbi:MAG: hypothetical protein RLZ35_587 [Pseudomonadota bacterium]|jgi:hypothetical protein
MSVQGHLISSHTLAVLDAFADLQTAMQTLHHQVVHHDATLPIWFSPPVQLGFFPQLSEREKVCLYLHQFEYLDTQLPKEILVGPGIVAASESTLGAIEAVNHAKQQFKKEMIALKEAHGSLRQAVDFHAAFDDLLNKRPSAVARNLQKMGLSRLHLKQCYRIIPCFKQKPEKIAWTWANTRAIKRISVAEAQQLLLKQGEEGRIAWQREKLAQLSQDEPLAIVQELAPHLRANIVFRDQATGISSRKMVKGPVPFFYLEEDVNNPATLPLFVPPREKKSKDKARPRRKDVKLDPNVFLPAIRAHRYA